MTKYQRPRSHYAVLIFNIAIAVSLLVVGGGLLYAGQRLGERQVVSLNRGDDVAINEDANISPSDQWNLSEGDLDAKNFLLTGSDNGSCVDPNSPYAGAFGDRNSFGERSDTIMIIRVNPKDNQAAFLSFPRDLWVKIAGSTRSNRINTAFERKNPNTLADTIYQNFGINIDHYVNIDFCAFKEIVDAVGGVKVRSFMKLVTRKLGCTFRVRVALSSAVIMRSHTFVRALAIPTLTLRKTPGYQTELPTSVELVASKISSVGQCNVLSTKDLPVHGLQTNS